MIRTGGKPQRLPGWSFVKDWIGRHRRLTENLSSLVIIQFTVAGVGFLTRVRIGNSLGKETFGDFSYALALGAYGVTFILFGMEKSFVRELAHFPDRFGELVKASLFLRFVLFLLCLAILAVAAPLLVDSSVLLGTLLIVISAMIMAFQLSSVYDSWKETRRHAAYYLIQRFLYFAAVWLVVLTPLFTLSLTMLGVFLLCASGLGLFLQYRWALPRIDFQTKEGLLPSTLFLARSNVWIVLAVVSGMSLEYLNQILLKQIWGSAALGEYSASWLIIHLAVVLLNQVGRIGAVPLAECTAPAAPAARRRRFLLKYMLLMGAIGALCGLPCVLFAGTIVSNCYDAEYASAVNTLRILGLHPMLFGPYLVALQYLISARLQRTYFALISLTGLLSIGLNCWLIPLYKSEGTAWALILSLGASLILFATAVAVHLRILDKSPDTAETAGTCRDAEGGNR